jgi:LmbE family N-acetylglucosaminyl deacetylase
MLVVFPHPDDEAVLGEVMIKYASLGYKVQLIVATDGRDGTRVTKIPPGDELARVRKEETLCAIRKIGIDEPIFLDLERLDTKIGTGKYFGEHKKLMKLLKEKVSSIKPDFIVTFGPDGDTSHSEHIVAGAAVTELLLEEGWVERYPLYYLSWTPELGKLLDLGYVDTQYLNVKITYTQDQENKALEMMPCYVTQYTPEEIVDDRSKKLEDKSNFLYFRRFAVKKGLRERF